MNYYEVSKSHFKAKALEYFREVEDTGESIIITDHGKPKLELRPFKSSDALDILKNSVISFTDPTEPVGNDDWENA